MSQIVLVVMFNHDCVCAYPVENDVAKQIGTIRQKVQERVKAEVMGSYGNPPSIRCQIVQLDMPGCTLQTVSSLRWSTTS